MPNNTNIPYSRRRQVALRNAKQRTNTTNTVANATNNNAANSSNNNAANNNINNEPWQGDQSDEENLRVNIKTSKYDDAIDLIDKNCHVDKLRYFQKDQNGKKTSIQNHENPIRQILENSITLNNPQHRENQIRYEYMRLMSALGLQNINEDNDFCKMMLQVEDGGKLDNQLLYMSHLKKLYNGYLNQRYDSGRLTTKDGIKSVMRDILNDKISTSSVSTRDKLNNVISIITKEKKNTRSQEFLQVLQQIEDAIYGGQHGNNH